jgi:hypothetical protein
VCVGCDLGWRGREPAELLTPSGDHKKYYSISFMKFIFRILSVLLRISYQK